MPAVSQKQRSLMALAEHHPDQVFAKNKGVLGMGKSMLHDFASTSTKNLPKKVAKKKGK